MLKRSEGALIDSLSDREKQLLQLAAAGFTDQAIANRLGISLATVGTYWGRVRIKLGPLNRTELVAIALRHEASRAISELKEHNAELLAQIESRTKAEEMLRTSLQMFKGILESAPDAIIVVDSEGTIDLANTQAEQMFGYGEGELLGKKVESLIPERYRRQHVENRLAYEENPTTRRMGEHLATMALRRSGEEFPIATALSATPASRGILVTCIIRDLTMEWGSRMSEAKPVEPLAKGRVQLRKNRAN